MNRNQYAQTALNLIWWIVLALALSVFAVSKWEGYASLQTACGPLLHCENALRLTDKAVSDLAAFGISASLYSALLIIFMSISNLSSIGVAILLYRAGRRDPFCLAASLFLVVTGTIFSTDQTALAHWPSLLAVFHAMDAVGSFYLPFLFLFPDGRFAPRWTLIPALLWSAVQIYRLIVPEHWSALSWNPLFMTVLLLVTHGPFLFSLRERLRRADTVKESRYLKWFAFGLLGYIAGGLLSVLPYMFQNGLLQLAVQVIFYAVLLFWPMAIGIGVLERRLGQSAVMLHRAIMFVTLSFLMTLLYAFSVSAFGVLLRGDDSLISLLASGVIAVLLYPAHHALQKGVNRLVHGDPEHMYQPLATMIAQLESGGRERSVWIDIVSGIAQSLSLSYVCLQKGEEDVKIAEYGASTGEAVRVPLVWEGRSEGALMIGPENLLQKLPEEHLILLRHFMRQIGFALHAQRLNEELRESKERLVHAREEERRRLRRDLHDGLGAHLASILLKTESIYELAEDNERLQKQVTVVQEDIESAIADIRTLVYALRPPALDEFGLLLALRELGSRFSENGKLVRIDAAEPLPTLGSAVETALYRIVQEAVTNSFRHGGASECRVELKVEDSVSLTITDNGSGFGGTVSYGVGIRSMKERAGELGGVCEVHTSLQGVTVRATIPFGKDGAGHVAGNAGDFGADSHTGRG